MGYFPAIKFLAFKVLFEQIFSYLQFGYDDSNAGDVRPMVISMKEKVDNIREERIFN